MGQDFKECWLSACPAIGEAFERASAGETSFIENQRMFLDRNGYLEETFFTFSFSPIRDETGGVGGLFHPVTEMTQQTLAERRLEVLRDLADRTADTKTVREGCSLVTQILAEYQLDLPFTLLYLLDADGKQAQLVECTGIKKGTMASPEVVNLEASQPAWSLAFAEVVKSGQTKQIDDLESWLAPLSIGPYAESPQTALVMPINLPGVDCPFGLLVAGVSSRRRLDRGYHTFYMMLEESVTKAIANARAYEEERKRAEALAEVDRAKTAFFNNISHEFRTPLTLMLDPLEDTLANPNGPMPSDREQLEIAYRNSQRLLKVNTLLDFSQIEAGRIEAVYEPTDLAMLTAELAGVFRSAIERVGVRLRVDCPPLPEPAYVDREMWEKIVLNLVSNAFKFTLDGEISVVLRSSDRQIELQVQDTGTGIPEEELSQIFERFYRVKRAGGRSFEGSGIGLSLVQELVKLHQGTIKVSSVVDRGTCFTVSIPRGCASKPSERRGAPRTLASTAMGAELYVEEALRWLPLEEELTSTSKDKERVVEKFPLSSDARILIADDNADMRQYLKRLLSQQYEVETVKDGVAALTAIRQQMPDLLLTDVMMPRLNGFELLQSLRTQPQTRELPIILLSARAGEESRIEGLEAGADDYLIKPFSARELLARVQATLKLAQLRQEATRREQNLKAAEETQKQVSTILESITDAFLACDRQWRFTYANEQALRLLHKTREELLGKQVWFEVFPEAVGTQIYHKLHHAITESVGFVSEYHNTIAHF